MNSFTPINRIPPEVLSLIPDYYREDEVDQGLIALKHVCSSWRETFASRSSLWTRLDFKNVDKTRAYTQGSQSSPLKIYLTSSKVIEDAFPLISPHIRRLESLTIDAKTPLGHFCCHVPLLEKLAINISTGNKPVLDGAHLNRDLSSLHELRLCRVITRLPWKNLANLRVFSLKSCSPSSQ